VDSFVGQGVILETLTMQDLHEYQVGGIIHVVINNQENKDFYDSVNRFSFNCTDVALTCQSPIFHVNADSPELVDEAMRMAFQFRQQFKKNVVVEIVGYNRHVGDQGQGVQA